MIDTNKVRRFNAPDGSAFMMLNDMPADGELLYSPDGDLFYALATGGCSGTYGVELNVNISFANPHDETTGRLHLTNEAIEFAGKRYIMQDPSETIAYRSVPLPPKRCTEYLCSFEDGTLLYVSRDVYNWSYEGFKLFIGKGQMMQQHPNQYTARYRDGGTTIIKTPDGTFYSPTASHPDEQPTWTANKVVYILERLDEKDFDIIETPDGQVTITKKG